jgi:hypothetical protein
MDDGCDERRAQEEAERRGHGCTERERELRGGSDSYRVVYSRPGCKENLHTPLTETSGPFHSAQAHH